MGVYEDYGLKRVINTRSTTTMLGGGIMHPEILEAMMDAAKSPVAIRNLDVKLGEIIANICGAESAIITTSVTGGLVISFAGVAMRETELIKYDPWKNPEGDNPDAGDIRRLIQRQLYNPSEIEGIKTEILVPFAHETLYTICAVYAGLKPIWVGDKKKCSPIEIENCISDKTAAVFISGEELFWKHPTKTSGIQTDLLSGVPPVPLPNGYDMPFEEIIEVAHKHDVPIVMDAAYTIPPIDNLHNWVDMGVDIVCYCGGKSICGPNDVGFNIGRNDLIKLAACHRFPNHGIGRGMKVDKIEMIAITKALQMYPKLIKDNIEGAKKVAKFLVEELRKIRYIKRVECKIAEIGNEKGWPIIGVAIAEEELGMTMEEVVHYLQIGDPPIWTYGPRYSEIHFYNNPAITMNCQTLYHGTRKFPGNERIVVKRFKEILAKKGIE